MILDFFKKDYNKKAENLYYNINGSTNGFKFIRPETNPKIDKVISTVTQFNQFQKEIYKLIDESNKLDKKGIEYVISSIGAIYRHNIMKILKNNLEAKKIITKEIENLLLSYNQVYGEIVKKINNTTLYEGLKTDYLEILKITEKLLAECKGIDTFQA